jgi:hypothetical protein
LQSLPVAGRSRILPLKPVKVTYPFYGMAYQVKPRAISKMDLAPLRLAAKTRLHDVPTETLIKSRREIMDCFLVMHACECVKNGL